MFDSRSLRTRAAATTLGAALLLTACGSGGTDGGQDDGSVQVLASFYPLQYVAEQIGGDLVTVTSLTPPGAEPHDLELSPAHTRSIADSDLVLFLSGFQPAVDEAITARAPEHVVDAADSAELVALDPHFWLDPVRLTAVSEDVVAELSAVDPDNAATYAERGDELAAALGDLDEQLTSGLAECTHRVVVTPHEAFGYLGERYDLDLVGISGIDPESEPSPARLREVGEVVTTAGVTTIYLESLASSKVTDTLAASLGVSTAVLDPLEVLADESKDYRSVMLENLDALRAGQGCA